MNKQTHRRDICVLTDGLSSAIRWRLDDYAHMLRAQLALLAGSDSLALQPARALPRAAVSKRARTSHASRR